MHPTARPTQPFPRLHTPLSADGSPHSQDSAAQDGISEPEKWGGVWKKPPDRAAHQSRAPANPHSGTERTAPGEPGWAHRARRLYPLRPGA